MANEPHYPKRYGAWALIAGGSDGLGAALSHELAARGMNCLLVARRAPVLDALAEELRAAHGVEVRTLSLDLSMSDAPAQLEAATAALDLGIVVFNAGAEASGSHFVDTPFADWLPTLQRNIVGLTDALHRFATHFRSQGRGGIVIVGSEAAFGGAARGALYTASKGYSLNLGESLWAELAPHGVDVLTLLFRISDTPMLRSVLARKGIPVEATGATPPAEIARATIAALPHGPVLNFDEASSPTGGNLASGVVRRENVQRVSAGMEGFYG
ncbi:MAG: family NAD(P)-dependent oxidoreductase [Sphingomonas bacterium]|nr:family NAD(P)-dependent oxidoreductase [Sphingomonas bacterium]